MSVCLVLGWCRLPGYLCNAGQGTEIFRSLSSTFPVETPSLAMPAGVDELFAVDSLPNVLLNPSLANFVQCMLSVCCFHVLRRDS